MSRLEDLARNLPRALPPGRDLWPAIAHRARRRSVLARAARLAGMALGAAALVGTASLLVSRRRAELASRSALERFAELAADYEHSRQELLAALDALRDSLGAGPVERVEQDLELVDQEIDDARAAFLRRPEDAGLALALAGRYSRAQEVVAGTARLARRTVLYLKE